VAYTVVYKPDLSHGLARFKALAVFVARVWYGINLFFIFRLDCSLCDYCRRSRRHKFCDSQSLFSSLS